MAASTPLSAETVCPVSHSLARQATRLVSKRRRSDLQVRPGLWNGLDFIMNSHQPSKFHRCVPESLIHPCARITLIKNKRITLIKKPFFKFPPYLAVAPHRRGRGPRGPGPSWSSGLRVSPSALSHAHIPQPRPPWRPPPEPRASPLPRRSRRPACASRQS